MSNIISFFQKLIKGGVGIRAGGLENFSKIKKRGGDDYSVLESICIVQDTATGPFCKSQRKRRQGIEKIEKMKNRKIENEIDDLMKSEFPCHNLTNFAVRCNKTFVVSVGIEDNALRVSNE